MSALSRKDLQAGLGVVTRLELYFSTRFITRTLRRFAQLLDNDYDTLMVFLVVAESCLQAIIPLGGSTADIESLEKGYEDSISLGLSALNIGEATGIPRETVRRKVKTLTDLGLLATAERSRHIYVPLRALLEPEMLEVIRSVVGDASQFVKTVQFHSKGEP